MNKKYQKALVYFMWIKDKEIKKAGFNLYMDIAIEDIIMKLSNKLAKSLYYDLKENILEYNVDGIDEDTCIFCMIIQDSHQECKDCLYAEIKGNCYDTNSTYDKMIRFFDSKKISFSLFLDNKFYRRIIKDIEEKFLKEK